MRFFGKFLGIASDYYVFETTLSSPPDQPEETLGEWLSLHTGDDTM